MLTLHYVSYTIYFLQEFLTFVRNIKLRTLCGASYEEKPDDEIYEEVSEQDERDPSTNYQSNETVFCNNLQRIHDRRKRVFIIDVSICSLYT